MSRGRRIDKLADPVRIEHEATTCAHCRRSIHNVPLCVLLPAADGTLLCQPCYRATELNRNPVNSPRSATQK